MLSRITRKYWDIYVQYLHWSFRIRYSWEGFRAQRRIYFCYYLGKGAFLYRKMRKLFQMFVDSSETLRGCPGLHKIVVEKYFIQPVGYPINDQISTKISPLPGVFIVLFYNIRSRAADLRVWLIKSENFQFALTWATAFFIFTNIKKGNKKGCCG